MVETGGMGLKSTLGDIFIFTNEQVGHFIRSGSCSLFDIASCRKVDI